jgi:NAD-dependent deacetylase
MDIVVFTGAGISAESGINTFRDKVDGLWNNFDVDTLATAQAWKKKGNRPRMLEFFNTIAKDIEDKKPNAAHLRIAEWEKEHNVSVITQNIDMLHEKAGSTNVIHLHGEIDKVRSTLDNTIYPKEKPILEIGDKCPKGSQLRPHLVLFGEMPYNIEAAVSKLISADVFIVVGCSFEVGYVLELINTYLHPSSDVIYIDTEPVSYFKESFPQAKILNKLATEGINDIIF